MTQTSDTTRAVLAELGRLEAMVEMNTVPWHEEDMATRLIAALRAAHEALDEVQRWSEAYPETVFSEPDWKQARQLLESGGITLDAVSAGAIRPVVQGIGERAVASLTAIAQALGTEGSDEQ